uniref:Uncharacterized protein n=1 Tax=Schizaphis graminum TaxID=13262 RepID=A0A2S2NHQ8_SCHGA
MYTHILYNTHTCCYNQKSHIDKHSFRLHIVAIIIIIMCVRVRVQRSAIIYGILLCQQRLRRVLYKDSHSHKDCEDEGSDTRGTGSWERGTRIISAVSGPSGVHAITPKLLIFPLSTCES